MAVVRHKQSLAISSLANFIFPCLRLVGMAWKRDCKVGVMMKKQVGKASRFLLSPFHPRKKGGGLMQRVAAEGLTG